MSTRFRQEGLALQHAAPRLRAAPLVVMRAMKRNAAAFHFADRRLHEEHIKWIYIRVRDI